MLNDTQIQITKITDEARFEFTANLFGENVCIEGELAVYHWMRRLCSSYNGGYWQFYGLSNGGFLMCPTGAKTFHLVWSLNWSDEVVSAQAAGIVATLFALSQVMETNPDDLVVENYYRLREFLAEHPEAEAMFRLID